MDRQSRWRDIGNLGQGFQFALTVIGSGILGFVVGRSFSKALGAMGLAFGLIIGFMGATYRLTKMYP